MSKKPQPLPDPVEEPFTTVEGLANCLGVGTAVAYGLVRSGEVQSVRVGRLIRVPTSELHRLAGRTPSA